MVYSSTIGGHSGINATMHRIKVVVYWKGMTKDVKHFVLQCVVYQRSKHNTLASPGLLQSLSIPDQIWQHITIDFMRVYLILAGSKSYLW